ncbi:protein SPEC3-like [Anguilla anguilla]|uniref:protein SPEC3-like n=1 Tax=Anguilla anguilla TaxID=7936 RepID=UPI0015ABB116|nr:protein SPEC3-like [Anguilla anguilla]
MMPEGQGTGDAPRRHSPVGIHRKWVGILGAIPNLSKHLAITCLLLNIFLPGTGTMLAGLALLCCPQNTRKRRGQEADPLVLACINLWVGLSQLFTVTFLLIGWLWSLVWGVILLQQSYHSSKVQVVIIS